MVARDAGDAVRTDVAVHTDRDAEACAESVAAFHRDAFPDRAAVVVGLEAAYRSVEMSARPIVMSVAVLAEIVIVAAAAVGDAAAAIEAPYWMVAECADWLLLMMAVDVTFVQNDADDVVETGER